MGKYPQSGQRLSMMDLGILYSFLLHFSILFYLFLPPVYPVTSAINLPCSYIFVGVLSNDLAKRWGKVASVAGVAFAFAPYAA
jgi:hypothetical protein